MKHALTALLCFALAGCVTSGGGPLTSDNFSGWSFVDGGTSTKGYAYAVVSKHDGHPVRSGDTSLRFELRSGDCGSFTSWSDCAVGSERKELRQGDDLNVGENWYHWSIYLPEDYPVIWQARNQSHGQFHNKNHHVPVFMYRFVGGLEARDGKWVFAENYTVRNFMDPFQGPHHRDTLLTLDEMRGKWSDILTHVRWTAGGKGFFRVYVNGNTTPAFEWLGPTNRRTHNTIFFKFGIYTTGISGEVPTRIVYYDDVRKGRTCAEVTEYFDCESLR